MEYTCCFCESKYDKMTGDTDERMCCSCMEKSDYKYEHDQINEEIDGFRLKVTASTRRSNQFDEKEK